MIWVKMTFWWGWAPPTQIIAPFTTNHFWFQFVFLRVISISITPQYPMTCWALWVWFIHLVSFSSLVMSCRLATMAMAPPISYWKCVHNYFNSLLLSFIISWAFSFWRFSFSINFILSFEIWLVSSLRVILSLHEFLLIMAIFLSSLCFQGLLKWSFTTSFRDH